MNSLGREVPPHFFPYLKQHHFLRQNTIIFESQYLKRSKYLRLLVINPLRILIVQGREVVIFYSLTKIMYMI